MEENPRSFHQFLTVKELASRFNVAPGLVYEQVKKQNIPYHKLGKHLRFDLEEVSKHYSHNKKVEWPEE